MRPVAPTIQNSVVQAWNATVQWQWEYSTYNNWALVCQAELTCHGSKTTVSCVCVFLCVCVCVLWGMTTSLFSLFFFFTVCLHVQNHFKCHLCVCMVWLQDSITSILPHFHYNILMTYHNTFNKCKHRHVLSMCVAINETHSNPVYSVFPAYLLWCGSALCVFIGPLP